MIKICLLIHLIIFLFLLSLNAYSFSSSSYLVAQSAITLNDYETASKHYEKENLSHLPVYDLQKRLIAFVNSNNLSKASFVAKEIIDLDINNQEAWLVYLADAKLKNELHLFKEFEKHDWGEEYNIVKYIYYNNGKLKQNNNDIARTVFDIIKVSESNNLKNIENYDYLLFYTMVALSFNPTFDEALFFHAIFFEQIKNYGKEVDAFMQNDSPTPYEFKKNKQK